MVRAREQRGRQPERRAGHDGSRRQLQPAQSQDNSRELCDWRAHPHHLATSFFDGQNGTPPRKWCESDQIEVIALWTVQSCRLVAAETIVVTLFQFTPIFSLIVIHYITFMMVSSCSNLPGYNGLDERQISQNSSRIIKIPKYAHRPSFELQYHKYHVLERYHAFIRFIRHHCLPCGSLMIGKLPSLIGSFHKWCIMWVDREGPPLKVENESDERSVVTTNEGKMSWSIWHLLSPQTTTRRPYGGWV